MAQRKTIKTTKKQIVNYWVQHVDESNLSVVSIPGGFTPLFRRLETIVPI